jgi:hypothetical protein
MGSAGNIPLIHGSLANVDVSGDPSIDHINIDKSLRLHARAINEVLAVAQGTSHRYAEWLDAYRHPRPGRKVAGRFRLGAILLSPREAVHRH